MEKINRNSENIFYKYYRHTCTVVYTQIKYFLWYVHLILIETMVYITFTDHNSTYNCCDFIVKQKRDITTFYYKNWNIWLFKTS